MVILFWLFYPRILGYLFINSIISVIKRYLKIFLMLITRQQTRIPYRVVTSVALFNYLGVEHRTAVLVFDHSDLSQS